MGATRRSILSGKHLSNFNPRPRMGATVACTSWIFFIVISIHAPVWGRPLEQQFPLVQQHFNPRPRMGATQDGCRRDWDGFISIHAPVWGRLALSVSRFAPSKFQSTPPYGGDHIPVRHISSCLDFNPRPRMGATSVRRISALPCTYSNPRPRMGATSHAALFADFHKNFNPRPRMGATGREPATMKLALDFNPRPRMGATSIMQQGPSIGAFQSTPPYGGDACWLSFLGSLI